jgi:hypothetical protein
LRYSSSKEELIVRGIPIGISESAKPLDSKIIVHISSILAFSLKTFCLSLASLT